MILNKKTIWSGICLALALLSGPQIISGILIFLLTGFIWTRLFKDHFGFYEGQQAENVLDLKKTGLIGAAALVLISTGFFLYPELITGFGIRLLPISAAGGILRGSLSLIFCLPCWYMKPFYCFSDWRQLCEMLLKKTPGSGFIFSGLLFQCLLFLSIPTDRLGTWSGVLSLWDYWLPGKPQ